MVATLTCTPLRLAGCVSKRRQKRCKKPRRRSSTLAQPPRWRRSSTTWSRRRIRRHTTRQQTPSSSKRRQRKLRTKRKRPQSWRRRRKPKRPSSGTRKSPKRSTRKRSGPKRSAAEPPRCPVWQVARVSQTQLKRRRKLHSKKRLTRLPRRRRPKVPCKSLSWTRPKSTPTRKKMRWRSLCLRNRILFKRVTSRPLTRVHLPWKLPSRPLPPPPRRRRSPRPRRSTMAPALPRCRCPWASRLKMRTWRKKSLLQKRWARMRMSRPSMTTSL
mmetsp:Transcript_10732/g.30779  ORF Transcript_10732/g.30779 Transcript_10732/m.30779 type:complete len:271 (+) Transcript_10732:699-1511(+)